MSGGKECWVSVPWISRSGEKYKPPRIGAKYQVKQIPPATLHAPTIEILGGTTVFSPSAISPEKVEDFLKTARMQHNVLTEYDGRTTYCADEHFLSTLHTNDYNTAKPIPPPGTTQDEWTRGEVTLFESAFTYYRRDFRQIQQIIRTKTLAQVITYYYSKWKYSTNYYSCKSKTVIFDQKKAQNPSKQKPFYNVSVVIEDIDWDNVKKLKEQYRKKFAAAQSSTAPQNAHPSPPPPPTVQYDIDNPHSNNNSNNDNDVDYYDSSNEASEAEAAMDSGSEVEYNPPNNLFVPYFRHPPWDEHANT